VPLSVASSQPESAHGRHKLAVTHPLLVIESSNTKQVCHLLCIHAMVLRSGPSEVEEY